MSHRAHVSAHRRVGSRATRRHNAALLLAVVLGFFVSACTNAGERQACSLDPGPGQIGTLCGFANPEDLEYVPEFGLVVVSNMRNNGGGTEGGFLSAFRPGSSDVFRLWPREADGQGLAGPASDDDAPIGDPDCITPPPGEGWEPHGITSRADGSRTLLYVIGHENDVAGTREAIEIFELTPSDPSGRAGQARQPNARPQLIWRSCIPTQDGVVANDVATTSSGEVIASNYLPKQSLFLTIKANLFGSTTGHVARWNAESGWTDIPKTEAALANGVAVSEKPEMVFYAELGTGLVHRTPIEHPRGRMELTIGGLPDNFTWTERGTLLIATHQAGPGMLLCTLGRTPCRSPWAVYELDPRTMVVQELLSHDGEQIGAVATALAVGNTLYLGSVFDDRIGVVILADNRGRASS